MIAKQNRLLSLMGILVLFVSLGEIGMGAELISVSTGSSDVDGGDWKATNYYIQEMVVLRTHRGEAFNITLPSGPLLRGWRPDPNKNDREEFQNVMRADHSGIEIYYTGSLTVDNYHNSYYQEEGHGAEGNKLWMKLRSKKWSMDRPTLNGTRNIKVASSVPEGSYNIKSIVNFGSKTDIQIGRLIIRTVPSLHVDDIDFGTHPSNRQIKLKETSNIRIENGIAGEKYTLSLKSDSGSGTGDRFIMYLRNPNNNEEIPVELSIEGGGRNLVFGSTGNDNRTLEATVDTKTPSKGGTYSGSATIVFQYD